jgi:O-antigen/teichoic acid export membrane protein
VGQSQLISRLLKDELKAAATYAAIQIATRLGGYVALPFYWAKLNPADFGIIAISEIMTTFLSSTLNLSLEQSVTRFYCEWKEEDRPRKLGAIWLANWSSILMLGGLLLATGRFFLPFAFPEVPYYPLLMLGAITAIATSFTGLPFATMRIRQEPRRYGVFTLLRFILQTALTMFLVLGTDLGVMGYLLGMAIGSGLFAVACAVMMRQLAILNWDWPVIRESLHFSVPLIPSQVMNAASATLDRVLLKQFGSLELLGIYSISLKFAGIVSAVNEMLKLSYGPFVFKTMGDHGDGAWPIVSKIVPWYLAAILAAGTGVTLFTDEFVALSGSREYAPILNYVPWLVLIAVASSVNIYFAPGANLVKKTKWLIIPSLLQLLVMCGLGPNLIPGYGIPGVVASKAAAVGVYLFTSVYLSVRLFDRWICRWNVLIAYTSILIGALALALLTRQLPLWENTLLSVLYWLGSAGGVLAFLWWQTHSEIPKTRTVAT